MIETIVIVAVALLIFLAGYWLRGHQELVEWRNDSVFHKKGHTPSYKASVDSDNESHRIPKETTKARPRTGNRFDKVIND